MFELWLLLHYKNVEATAGLTCKQIEKELSEIAGGYTKKSCGRLLLTGTMVNEAVTRARSLDVPESMIPDTLVTRKLSDHLRPAGQRRDRLNLAAASTMPYPPRYLATSSAFGILGGRRNLEDGPPAQDGLPAARVAGD